MIKPDRNRAFDTEEMTRLLEVGVKTMEVAIETSQALEDSMRRTRQILEELPSQCRTYRTEATIDRLQGTLVKPEYEACISLLKNNLPRLIEEVPAIDEKYAAQMRQITQETRALTAKIDELKSRVEGLGNASAVECFFGILNQASGAWGAVEQVLGGLYEALVRFAKGGEKESMPACGDPVDTATGNYVYDREDLCVPGKPALSVKRFYNAMDEREGSLGKGWTHPYEIRLLREKVNTVTLILEDGREEDFTWEGEEEGWFCKYSLAVLSGGNPSEGEVPGMGESSETIEGCWRYEDPDGNYHTFDGTGRCTESGDRIGNRLSFRYGETGRLEEVTRSNGGSLLFSYHKEGHLASAEDKNGRKTSYLYESGRLVTVTTPEGTTLSYGYEEDGRIQTITNPRGICGVKNTYDAKGRMSVQEFPDGSRMGYAYEEKDRSTTFTERNGSQTTYYHDEQLRHICTKYEDGVEHIGYNAKNQRVIFQDKRGNKTRYRYDDRWNLTGVTDPLGNRVNLTYGEGNRPVSIRINGVQKLKAVYDRKGNLLSAEDALGRKRKFSYTEGNRVSRVQHSDGSTTELSYDESGNILRIRNPYGAETSYGYDTLNRVTETTDPLGNTTRYAYDAENRITEVTNAEGGVRSYEYNESGKLTGITDFDGHRMTCSYNCLNKPEHLTGKEGNITTLSYDSMWNISRRQEADGGVTNYRYDRMNRLESVTNPVGGTTAYGYDPCGNPVSVKRAGGVETRFVYDALNRIIQAIDPDGAETGYEYDGEGNLTKITDACGHEAWREYDAAGQLIKETNPAGESTCYTYTSLGKPETVTDAAGCKTTYSYSAGGLLTEIRYPDGTKTCYAYDDAGNTAAVTAGDDYRVTYTYDSLNRMVKAEDSMGKQMEYEYDALGRVTGVTDGEGNQTAYRYSPSGNLMGVTDALGNKTEYTYDTHRNLLHICQYGEDGIVHETRYERDLLGRPVGTIDALGRSEHYHYDALGHLKEKTDREGIKTRYEYGLAGELTGIGYGDGSSVAFGYNPLRQLTEIRDSLGVTRMTLDALGRVITVTDPNGRSVEYAWGSSGERTGIIYPDGRMVQYHYDEALRLSELRNGETVLHYRYDKEGRLSGKELPNGVVTEYEYQADGCLKSLYHRRGEEFLEGYRYGYDRLGNRTETRMMRSGLEEESGIWRYAYDALSRLTGVEKNGTGIRSYDYDAYGNRSVQRELTTGKETVYTYNGLNQLMRSEAGETRQEYGYDLRGNQTDITENGVVKNQYEYGAANRLIKAFGSHGKEALYQYNGLGMRTGKTERNVGSLKPTYEIDYILDMTRSYHNLLQKQENGTMQSYLWDGNVTGTVDEGGSHYYCQDIMGSPVRYLDGEGRTEAVYGYDEFGSDLYGNQGELQPFGYTGYQKDRITDTYFAQAREYLPGMGRFGAEDLAKGKTSAPYSLNSYGYCWNNPMVLVDLNGLWPQSSSEQAMAWDWYWGRYLNGAKDYIEQKKENIGNAVSNAWDGVVSVGSDIADTANYIWKNHIYGEEIVMETTTNTGSGLIGGYTKNIESVTKKSEKYKGSIIVMTKRYSTTDISDYSVGLTVNAPTISWGDGKSLGVPLSIGGSVGSDGLDINFANGFNFIYLKGKRETNINIAGENFFSIDRSTAVEWLNQKAGISVGVPINPDKSIKIGVFTESEYRNLSSHYEMGGHLKTGTVYIAALLVPLVCLMVSGTDTTVIINQLKGYLQAVSNSCSGG